jgi:hypothetical protein
LQGVDAAQKAVTDQDKYDFIVNSPELENWLESLGEMDLTVKVAAVGVTLNRVIHWEGVHKVIENLDLSDTQDRSIKKGDDDEVYTRPVRATPASTPAASPAMARAGGTPAASPAPPGSPADTVPNAIYVNGLPSDCTEADIREVFGQFGDIKMVNARCVGVGVGVGACARVDEKSLLCAASGVGACPSSFVCISPSDDASPPQPTHRHAATGGFSFVFFRNEQGAAAALENPRITIKDKVANVLAKKQILGSGGR